MLIKQGYVKQGHTNKWRYKNDGPCIIRFTKEHERDENGVAVFVRRISTPKIEEIIVFKMRNLAELHLLHRYFNSKADEHKQLLNKLREVSIEKGDYIHSKTLYYKTNYYVNSIIN